MRMKCTTVIIHKTRIRFSLNQGFHESRFSAKIEGAIFRRNSFLFKFSTLQKIRFNCRSSNLYTKNRFSCRSFNTNSHKKIKEYSIKNNEIVENIVDFKRIAAIFINMYNLKKQENIIVDKPDNPYIMLQYNQDKIYSLDSFKAMKIEDLIDEELLFIFRSL